MKVKAGLLMCLMLGTNNISAVNDIVVKTVTDSIFKTLLKNFGIPIAVGAANGASNAASRVFTEKFIEKLKPSKHKDMQKYENKQGEYKNYLFDEQMGGEPSLLRWGKGNDIGITKIDENKLILLKPNELTILNAKNYAVLKSYTFVPKNSKNNTGKGAPKIIPISTRYISETTTLLHSNNTDGELELPLGTISKVIPIPTKNCLCIIFEYGKCIFFDWMNGKILDEMLVDGGQNKELLEKYYGEMSYACLANSPGFEEYWHITFDPIVNAWFWHADECLYLSVKCKSKKIATIMISSQSKQYGPARELKE